MVCIVGKFPVWMTQKPRKGDFGELKSKKKSRGSMPQTYVEVGNRSVFILDPRPTQLALLNSSCFFGKKKSVWEKLFFSYEWLH